MAEPRPRSQSRSEITGRKVFAVVAAFFLIIFAANILLAWLALDSWPGLETKSSYEAGRVYQREIDASRQQASRNWRVKVHLERRDDGLLIRLEARDRDGAPVTGIGFAARFARPTTTRKDRSVTLSETEPGIYRGVVSAIEAGTWTVILEADNGSERLYRSRNRIVIE